MGVQRAKSYQMGVCGLRLFITMSVTWKYLKSPTVTWTQYRPWYIFKTFLLGRCFLFSVPGKKKKKKKKGDISKPFLLNRKEALWHFHIISSDNHATNEANLFFITQSFLCQHTHIFACVAHRGGRDVDFAPQGLWCRIDWRLTSYAANDHLTSSCFLLANSFTEYITYSSGPPDLPPSKNRSFTFLILSYQNHASGCACFKPSTCQHTWWRNIQIV